MRKDFIAAVTIFTLWIGAAVNGVGEPEHECIFSIQKIHDSGTGEVKRKNGVYVYLHKDVDPEGRGRESTMIAVFRNGKKVSYFGGGSAVSFNVLSSLRSANLPDIDYKELIERTEKKKLEDTGLTTEILGGAEYELRVNYGESKCSIRMWNPIPKIEDLADFNPILKRLNRVIEAIVLEVGKEQIDI